MQGLYFFIPVFVDAKSCQELDSIIKQNINTLAIYFNALPFVTNESILNAQDILKTLQNNLFEFQNNIETICEDVIDDNIFNQ